MPKSLKKSCTTQTSISRYFGGLSSSTASRTQCGINPNPDEPRLSQGKVRCASWNTWHGYAQIRYHVFSVNANHWTSAGFALQQKLSSDDDLGLPAKRAKISLQDQQLEDLGCEPASCQSTKGECVHLKQKLISSQHSHRSHTSHAFPASKSSTFLQSTCAVMSNPPVIFSSLGNIWYWAVRGAFRFL